MMKKLSKEAQAQIDELREQCGAIREAVEAIKRVIERDLFEPEKLYGLGLMAPASAPRRPLLSALPALVAEMAKGKEIISRELHELKDKYWHIVRVLAKDGTLDEEIKTRVEHHGPICHECGRAR